MRASTYEVIVGVGGKAGPGFCASEDQFKNGYAFLGYIALGGGGEGGAGPGGNRRRRRGWNCNHTTQNLQRMFDRHVLLSFFKFPLFIRIQLQLDTDALRKCGCMMFLTLLY